MHARRFKYFRLRRAAFHNLILTERIDEFFEKIHLRFRQVDKADRETDLIDVVDDFAPEFYFAPVRQREKYFHRLRVLDLARTQDKTTVRRDIADRSVFAADEAFPFDIDVDLKAFDVAAVAPASSVLYRHFLFFFRFFDRILFINSR